MDRLQTVAFISVGRACAFGALAIFCFVMGLSPDPIMAAKSGGVLTLVMTGILLLKRHLALKQNHRKTECWAMLPEKDRPPEAYAQRLVASVMRETYLWFARNTVLASIVFWAAALIMSLTGVTGTDTLTLGASPPPAVTA